MSVRNPIPFIFITVLIDCIGIGIIIPVIATIISEIGQVPVNKATTYSGIMMTGYALMQFAFSPLLGSLSDRFGRRPVLLLSLFGLGVNYLFLTFAHTLALFFLGRVIAGICGASFSTAFACIADVSPPEKRAQNFGLVGAAFGLGFIIGPVLGGLFSEFGSRAPFALAAVLSFINCIYGYFILPETLKPDNRRPFNIKDANPFRTFIQLRNNKNIQPLVISMFLLYMAAQVMPSIWAFYTKFLYQWSDIEIGYSMGFVGIMITIVQGGLIRFSQKKLGTSKSIYFGLFMYVLGLALFSFANKAWMMYAYTFIYSLGGIAPPTIQALISSQVSPKEQGNLQGMLTSLNSLTSILSPLIMTNLFYQFTKNTQGIYFPGVSFAAAAIFVIIGIWYARKGLIRHKN
ncbi:MAG: TCR/Tet family MFS transporter [Bacteroidia bacterium]|nr:TCR/Tet family MFS transporter [Bacteroidia bacterium]MCZ2249199.1 TCR/Tet family MFS transporter [Bacteroidia bacterium]